MSVWVSSGAFQARNLDALLVEAAGYGIRALELSSGLKAGAHIDRSLEAALEAGTKFLIHNYFPAPASPFVLNLAAPDNEARSRSVAFAKQAIDISAQVGAPFYSLHAGFAVALTPEHLGRPELQRELASGVSFDRDAALERMRGAVIELVAHAAPLGVRLLLENNVVSPRQVADGQANPLLMADPDEAMSFLSALRRDDVGLLLDVGHARVSGTALGFDPCDFFEKCGEWIGGLHLSDNDGVTDNNRPFTESSWFVGRLADVAALPMVVEVYGMDEATMRDQIVLTEKVKGR